MDDPADAGQAGAAPPDEPAAIEIDCEHCGHRFAARRPPARKIRCPQCGGSTLVPLQREPVWFLAVAGCALAAIAVPGLTYRLAGPWFALPVAVLTLGAVWWFGRRL
jgi:DNA-directed RNA polymerase subunit RPC12/RpoP